MLTIGKQFRFEAAHTPNVAVVVKAAHTCMTIRGAKAHGSETITSTMLGEFRASSALRAEFLQLLG